MAIPQEARERGRRLYHTRFRQMNAVRHHLIGMGVPDVGWHSKGYDRRITIPGFNVRLATNLRRDMAKKGRKVVLDEMIGDDERPLLIFEVPTYVEDPEEILVTMPINTFISIIRKDA